eukprot:6189670-Pleurochrysis_carterae.AAC.2
MAWVAKIITQSSLAQQHWLPRLIPNLRHQMLFTPDDAVLLRKLQEALRQCPNDGLLQRQRPIIDRIDARCGRQRVYGHSARTVTS